MNLRGSIQKHIRGENNEFINVRDKLKNIPNNLEDIKKITSSHPDIQDKLVLYYKKKGLQ